MKFKKVMIIALIIIAALFVSVLVFMNQAKFGKLPNKEMQESFQKSPNFKDGQFQNIHHTPVNTHEGSFFKVLYDYIFTKKVRLSPVDEIPATKTDLKTLKPDENVLVWFGHSSYFMQIDGKRILVDPVLSGLVSPISLFGKAYKGTDVYTADDIPEIDYLFITHDHWDHVDYETLIKLRSKIKKIICGLGVGAHFEYWGFDSNIIIEKDWDETETLEDGILIHTTTARHFSGRGLTRNKSLWLSYVLETPIAKIFIGGDSGFDTHFKEIGEKFGPFDIAILENGQYDKKWNATHMFPNQVLQAANDLEAKRLFPVHSGKFTLAEHPWDEPLSELLQLNTEYGLNIMTPIIGEKVMLMDSTKAFTNWWENIN